MGLFFYLKYKNMSIKLKKDLGLKDYLDLIAKQNEAIIDQLMVDPDTMTSTFRLTYYKQYKKSVKAYTVAEKAEEPEDLKTDVSGKPIKKETVDFRWHFIIWGIVVLAAIWVLIQNGII
tara:strand:- start:526 stop:882 length:357 start_codon:yes stop_codon:yes gene_type:complete